MTDELGCVTKVVARPLTLSEAELVDCRCRQAVHKREPELQALRRGELNSRK